MHQKCFHDYIKTTIACPLCRKSVIEPSLVEAHYDAQIALTIMPIDYRNKLMTIQCNDCQHKCKVKFHIMGGKCEKCRSYNTTNLGEGLETIP